MSGHSPTQAAPDLPPPLADMKSRRLLYRPGLVEESNTAREISTLSLPN